MSAIGESGPRREQNSSPEEFVGQDRRSVLRLMAASLAMSGLTACTPAPEIVPYVRKPEDLVPGRSRHYATALEIDGYGFGAIVASREGRPIKIEGNPDHPASLGAADAIMQAACLSLYDPDRSRSPLHRGELASWNEFLAEASNLGATLSGTRGEGMAIVASTITSPSLAWQIERLRAKFPSMVYCRHDPLGSSGEDEAFHSLFGRRVASLPRLDQVKVLVSLDADFLGEGPARLANARALAARRILRDGANEMARLYVFESTPSITGASADHRWPVRTSQIPAVATALASRFGFPGAPESNLDPGMMDSIARDLRRAGSAGLVLAGAHQPASVHRIAHAINARLGGFRRTVDYIPAPDYRPEVAISLAELIDRINGDSVFAVVILGGNPVYTAPGDLDFSAALRKTPLGIHWGLYPDATAAACTWHIPAQHDLERWGDLRAFDGAASIVQPLIRPLYAGRSAAEVILALLGEYNRQPLELVRDFWRSELGVEDADWNGALQRGTVPNTAARPLLFDAPDRLDEADAAATSDEPPIEIRLMPDHWLRAGEHGNNAWLQELPRPVTKLVWGNAALIAPQLAARLGIASDGVLEFSRRGRRISIPAWVSPGQPDGCVALALGFGQIQLGNVGEGVGVDVYPLRGQDSPWLLTDVEVRVTGEKRRVVSLHRHHALEGRDILRRGTLAAYRGDPAFKRGEQPTETLFRSWPYRDDAWGMVIDLTACIGCMACVAACQAENNIATVGVEECDRGHEMHWLRVDRYDSGDFNDPRFAFQPVPCMHCENAPCEEVCPVNATVHTHDGLNAQVYNRCIGTRYCSQNCPYKVRRFNFLEYQPFDKDGDSPFAPLMNPDVSVRSRGVMEKCTYCVQRIARARIDADIAGRAIGDGQVVTACEQACPTRAIVFGNLNDPTSRVRRLRDHPLGYTLLAELNTRPRTTYLARIGNPNPAVSEEPDRE